MMKQYVVVLVLVTLLAACGQTAPVATSTSAATSPAVATTTTKPITQATATTSEAAYPETAAGLQQLIEDLLATARTNDRDKRTAHVRELKLPNHEIWFQQVFGDEKGARVASEYGGLLTTFDTSVTQLFGQMAEEGRSLVFVERFTKASDPDAVGNQKNAFEAMKQPVALYSVNLVKPGESRGFHLYSFVYVESGFRLIGKMQALRE